MNPWPPDRSTMQGLVFGGTLLFQRVDLGKRSKIHPGYTPRPVTDGGSWRSVWPTSPGKLFSCGEPSVSVRSCHRQIVVLVTHLVTHRHAVPLPYKVQRAVVVTCVVTRGWLRAGHQSNRELPPITDSILVVRPDIQ
jgi:hypothetical protein